MYSISIEAYFEERGIVWGQSGVYWMISNFVLNSNPVHISGMNVE